MNQVEYFKTTPIAVVFQTQAQHKAILQFFGLKRSPWTLAGACSIFRFKGKSGTIHTYTCWPFALQYHQHGYVVISFYEFQQITCDGHIPGITRPLRTIPEIMRDGDASTGDYWRLVSLWNEIATNKYKYPIDDLKTAQEHFCKLLDQCKNDSR